MRKSALPIIGCLIVFWVSSVYALPPINLGKGKLLKFFYDAQFGLTSRDMGSGPEGKDHTNDFNFRRNRFGFIGQYNKWIGFYLQTEYIEDRAIGPLYVDLSDENKEFYLMDAQIRFNLSNAFNIRMGKLKHNLTRENLEACFEPLTFDRSLFVAAPFKTSRDYGIALWGNFLNNKAQYRFDVMEGKENGNEAPKSNFRYTGRVHFSLLDPEKYYGYKGTYLGKKRVLTIGGSYQYEPDVVYSDVVNHKGSKDYQAYSADLFFEYPTDYGTFTFSAAYLDIDFDNAYKHINPVLGVYPDMGSIEQNGEKHGYYMKTGYLLPKKVGPGKLQFFGRYDKFTFAHLGSNFNYGYDQDIDWYAVGLNYYILGQNLKVTAQYSFTDFEQEDLMSANFDDFQTFELFLQVRF